MSVTTLRQCSRDKEFWWAGRLLRPVQRIRRVVIQGYLVAQQSTPLLNNRGLPVPAVDVIQHDVVLVDRPHPTDAGWEFKYDDLRFRAARQSVARPASYGWHQHIHLMASTDDVDELKRLQGKLITLRGYEVVVGLEDDEIPGLRNEGAAWAWLGERALIQDEAEQGQADERIHNMVGSDLLSNCLILECQHLEKTGWVGRLIHFMKGIIMSAGGTAAANNAMKSLKETQKARQQRQPQSPEQGMMNALRKLQQQDGGKKK